MITLIVNESAYEPLPLGVYDCVFDGLDDTVETSKGKAYRWMFTVVDGEYNGRKMSALSDRESPPTIKNKTGKYIAFLCGKSLEKGIQVNPDDYVGRLYAVVVDNDGRVVSFKPKHS